MLCYKLDILGQPWKVEFLTKREFLKKHGDHAGMTTFDDKLISLRIDSLTLETILHEQFHAYIDEGCFRSSNLDVDQMEEHCCELVAKYGSRMIKQAEEVLHAYKVLRGRRVRK